MLSPGKIYPGTVIRIPIVFSDEEGVAVDPDSVTFRLMSPCRSESSYTYGTDAELTQTSAGNYQMDIPSTVLTEGGRWFYRWQTTGVGTTTALEGNFVVQASVFFDDICGDY
jgi:hypothetical protein